MTNIYVYIFIDFLCMCIFNKQHATPIYANEFDFGVILINKTSSLARPIKLVLNIMRGQPPVLTANERTYKWGY